MKYILTSVLLHIGLWSYSQSELKTTHPKIDSSNTIITTKLKVPFGTIQV